MNVSGELLAKVTCSSATVGVVPSTLTKHKLLPKGVQ